MRELGNAIERMVILREGDEIAAADLPEAIRPSGRGRAPRERGDLPFELPEGGLDLMDLERRVIAAALELCGGNRSATARYLRVPRHILVYRMQKFGIDAGRPPTQKDSE